MKNNTTPKKAWQKPDVSDLDVNTTAAKSLYSQEGTGLGPAAS
jgi:hypothetical protein